MTKGKDYYALLGVEKNADEKTIKSAYRKLARRYHPDVNPGDQSAEAKFKEVSEAYEVLSDPEKRKLYDRFGANWEAARQGGMPEGDLDFDFPGFGGFGQFFEQFLGGQQQPQSNRPRPVGPRDVEKEVEITLEEIDKGCQRTLQYATMDACKSCDGTGFVRTRSAATCSACSGRGQKQGIFGMAQACEVCGGTGTSSMERCPTCAGAGTLSTQRRMDVKIPAGINEGQKLRVPNGGARGAAGRQGDLYIIIREASHPKFKRLGSDLETTIDVALTSAALGDVVTVPTLRSSVKMTIPEGTQSGQKFRLSGQGLPSMKGERGALIVKVNISMPKKINDKQRNLLKQLKEEGI